MSKKVTRSSSAGIPVHLSGSDSLARASQDVVVGGVTFTCHHVTSPVFGISAYREFLVFGLSALLDESVLVRVENRFDCTAGFSEKHHSRVARAFRHLPSSFRDDIDLEVRGSNVHLWKSGKTRKTDFSLPLFEVVILLQKAGNARLADSSHCEKLLEEISIAGRELSVRAA